MPETITLRFENEGSAEVIPASAGHQKLVAAAVEEIIGNPGRRSFSLEGSYAGDFVLSLLQAGHRVVFEPRGGGEPEPAKTQTDLEAARAAHEAAERDLLKARIDVLTAAAEAGRADLFRDDLGHVVRMALTRKD